MILTEKVTPCFKTPLHVSIAQSIHNECRSKKSITILNWLGLSISYNEFQRIDCTLANSLLERLGEQRLAKPNSINSSLIQGAVDNCDCIRDTKSGKESSHDTILMIFQNKVRKMKKLYLLSYDIIQKRICRQNTFVNFAEVI